jgi:hypothetical protein
MINALNQRNRANKIRRARFEKSEDTLTWSVFSHLEGRGKLAAAIQTLTDTSWSEPADLLYWGYNDQGPQWLRERLVDVLEGFGERARSLSEPDLILHARQEGLVIVEVKYASANSIRFDRGKAERYFDGGRDYLKADCVGMKHYELLRNWVIGCVLATRLGLPFWLINLVRRGEENDIERDFGRFLQQDERRQFRRVEWDAMLEALCPVLDQSGDERFWEYIRTRTIFFQRTFSWERRTGA